MTGLASLHRPVHAAVPLVVVETVVVFITVVTAFLRLANSRLFPRNLVGGEASLFRVPVSKFVFIDAVVFDHVNSSRSTPLYVRCVGGER